MTVQQDNAMTILFLSADPSNATRLRLGEEQREVYEKIRLSNERDRLHFEVRAAVRPGDFVQALHDTRPTIVHFSGHGTPHGDICLEDDTGNLQAIAPDTLGQLFRLLSEQVRCVVLNACFSAIQAQAIGEHIDYVVGMRREIGDRAAIAFAVGFYRAVASGYPFAEAFEYGLVAIRLEGIPEHLTPVLMGRATGLTTAKTAEPTSQQELQSTTRHATSQITVILDGEYQGFTPREQDAFRFALSRIAGIPSDKIRILRVSEGSVIVVLEMPVEAAHTLARMFAEHSDALQALQITEIRSVAAGRRSGKPDRITGTVKWFNRAKGYGFIEAEGVSDVFVHFSAIAGEGFRNLDAGERVEFTIEDSSKGPVASDVQRLSDK